MTMAVMFQVHSLHFAGNVELNFALQLAYSVNGSEFKIIFLHFHVRDELYVLIF